MYAQFHWNENVIIFKQISSLAAPEVVIFNIINLKQPAV